MKRELKPLLMELCHLAVLRNEINTRRHRARFRKNYYAKAIRVVEAHNGSNSLTRSLDHIKHTNAILREFSDMEKLRKKYPKPTKWQTMGLHKLRSMVLKSEGEYAFAKHETMEFSIKHRVRVKYLVNALQCSLHYDNGSLVSVHFKSSGAISLDEIGKHAEQYELNKAVDGMLQE